MFDNYVKALWLSPNSLEFVDFLQSDECKEILLANKLKTHVETGNIYYDNQDTNESIYSFFSAQEDPDKAFIDFEFTFADSYEDYFQWLIVGSDSCEKTKLDVLTNNSKFLFYRFKDFLQQKLREPKPVRHSNITDDYTALGRIQNQNWQYLIKSILDACKSNNSGQAIEIKKLKIVENITENITICKKAYQSFYNQIAQNLINTINELPADKIEEINKDLQRANYWVNKDRNDLLDSWCDFFYNYGRFPGSQELILAPQVEIPNFVKTNTPLSAIDLFQKFNGTDGRALVSVHALVALNIYYGRSSEASKDALKEFFHNLTFQALTKENNEILIGFDKIANMVVEIIGGLLEWNQNTLKVTETINDNIKTELKKSNFVFDVPTETQIQTDMDKFIKKEKKLPTPPPPYESPPSITDEEIWKIYEEEKNNF